MSAPQLRGMLDAAVSELARHEATAAELVSRAGHTDAATRARMDVLKTRITHLRQRLGIRAPRAA